VVTVRSRARMQNSSSSVPFLRMKRFIDRSVGAYFVGPPCILGVFLRPVWHVNNYDVTTGELPLNSGDVCRLKMSLSSAAGGTTPKSPCPGFEPQQWRSSVCKNCFRSAERHAEHRSPSPPETEVKWSTDADHQTTQHGMDIGWLC